MTTTSTTTHAPAEAVAPAARPSPPPAPDAAAHRPSAPSRTEVADTMLERLAASDYAGALIAAEALLARDPLDGDALECAEMARSEMRRLYVARLGSLDRVPRVAMGLHGLLALPLDFRAGFVLSRVDGEASLGRIADECGLPPLHALRLLSELHLQRVIAFDA